MLKLIFFVVNEVRAKEESCALNTSVSVLCYFVINVRVCRGQSNSSQAAPPHSERGDFPKTLMRKNCRPGSFLPRFLVECH